MLTVCNLFAQSPLSGIPGLTLWLRADVGVVTNGPGDSVTTWHDQSGNGYDATGAVGSKPTVNSNSLNGLPAIKFNTTNLSFLSGPQITQFNNNGSICGLYAFIICKADGNSSGNHGGIFTIGSLNGLGNVPGWWFERLSFLGALYLNNNAANPATAYLSNSSGMGGTGTSTYKMFEVRKIEGQSTAIDVNTSTVTSTTTAGLSGSDQAIVNGTFTNGTYNIGLSPGYASPDGYFNGEIAEIILFDTCLNGAQIAQVESYLGTKYSPTVHIGPRDTTITHGLCALPLTAPTGFVSYTWSTGAVTSTPSIVVTPTANPTTYSVSVTDGNGCMDSTATPLSLPVYTPAPLIITAIGGNTVCSNATTTLTANNGGTSTYTWMPSVTSVSANSNSVTITPTNPTTYSVIGIDANGCVDTASKQIDIVPIPSSLSVTPNNYICSNNPVNSMVVTATNATGYIWVGPAPSTNTVSTSSTPSFTTPGMYTVYAVNSCGQLSAGSTVPLTKDSVTAAITAPTGTLTTGNAPDTVSFAGLGTSTNGIISNTSYNWNFGNGNSSSTQNPTEIYTAPSLIQNIYTATLTVTDSKGCWDTATVKITVNEIPTMIIIPNIFSPNGDGINDVFSIKATGISDFDCKIYDRWGILLHEWTGIDGGWDGKGKNGNNETDGTYFYIINYNDINNKTINKTGFFELVR